MIRFSCFETSKLDKLVSMVVMAILLGLPSACQNTPQIDGFVRDAFGRKLEGVSIKIEKSRFTATSNDAGKYQIAYVPGELTLSFSKPGFTSQHLQLNIQKEGSFPAEDVILCPMPSGAGLFWLSEKGLLALSPNEIEQKNERIASQGNQIWWELESMSPVLIIPPGKAMFVDNWPDNQELFCSPDGNVKLVHKVLSARPSRYLYDGRIPIENIFYEADKVYLITLDLPEDRLCVWANAAPWPLEDIIVPGSSYPVFALYSGSVEGLKKSIEKSRIEPN